MKYQIRQGDVFLEEVTQLPTAAKKQTITGRIEIEWGEVSTHCHTIPKETGDLYLEGKRQYLEVCLTAPMTHEEHGTIEVEPKKLFRRRQFTYDYAAEMAKQVLD